MSVREIEYFQTFKHNALLSNALEDSNVTTVPSLELMVHRSMSALESDWQEFEKKSRCSPFQRFSWIKALYEVGVNSDNNKQSLTELFLVSGHIDNKLVLILPLVIETSMMGKHLKWVGSDSSDYNGMILDAEYAPIMPNDLFQHIIKKIQKSIPDLDAIFLKRNFASQDVINTDSISSWETEYGSHTLKLSRDWKSLYSRVRSKKSKQRLQSKFRALKKTGNIKFKQVKNLDQRLEATRQILEWKSSQLTARGSRNPFGSVEEPSETRQVINASVADTTDTSAKVFGMYKDNELIAGMIAFVNDSKFYYFVSAYSPEIPNKFSIGTQLLVKTIELAARSDLKQYDFLLGDEAYKYDWCDTKVNLVHHIIPFTFKGKLFEASIKIRYLIKKAVLRSPILSNFSRKIIKIRSKNHSVKAIIPLIVNPQTPHAQTSKPIEAKGLRKVSNQSLLSERM